MVPLAVFLALTWLLSGALAAGGILDLSRKKAGAGAPVPVGLLVWAFSLAVGPFALMAAFATLREELGADKLLAQLEADKKRLSEELEAQSVQDDFYIAMNDMHVAAFKAAGVTSVDYCTDHGGIGYQTAQADIAVRELAAERDKLRAAIREHHAQKADDRCIEDDDKLYAAAGLPPCDRRVGDKFEMVKNYIRFVERRCEGGGWPTYAELEKRLVELEAAAKAVVESHDLALNDNSYDELCWQSFENFGGVEPLRAAIGGTPCSLS